MPAAGRFVRHSGAAAMVATARWKRRTLPRWRRSGRLWGRPSAILNASSAPSTPRRNRSGKRAKLMATKTILVDYLARVEGEGALDLQVKDGRVTSAQFKIFEPPRFFEAFLRGRGYAEVADIVARICGICPIAYQMSAVHAIENAFGAKVDGQLRALRRLIYCGEWIESHGLHVVMLHAPDFLGFPDGIAMARDHGEAVRTGLALKKAGNELMRAVGGREIHPVSVKAGGFHRVPALGELAEVAENLKRARDIAVGLVEWVATFPFPDLERDYEFVALRHPDEYPLNEGRLASSRGIDVDIAEYDAEFEERHVA